MRSYPRQCQTTARREKKKKNPDERSEVPVRRSSLGILSGGRLMGVAGEGRLQSSSGEGGGGGAESRRGVMGGGGWWLWWLWTLREDRRSSWWVEKRGWKKKGKLGKRWMDLWARRREETKAGPEQAMTRRISTSPGLMKCWARLPIRYPDHNHPPAIYIISFQHSSFCLISDLCSPVKFLHDAPRIFLPLRFWKTSNLALIRIA